MIHLFKFLERLRRRRPVNSSIPLAQLLGPLSPLPPHLLTDIIFPYLHPSTLLTRLVLVNSAFRDLCETQELWEVLSSRVFLSEEKYQGRSSVVDVVRRGLDEPQEEGQEEVWVRLVDQYRELFTFWSFAIPPTRLLRRIFRFGDDRLLIEAVEVTPQSPKSTLAWTERPIDPLQPSLFRIMFLSDWLSGSYVSLCYPDEEIELPPGLQGRKKQRNQVHIAELVRYHSDGSISLCGDRCKEMKLVDRVRDCPKAVTEDGSEGIGEGEEEGEMSKLNVRFPFESSVVLNVCVRPQLGLVRFSFGPLEEERELIEAESEGEAELPVFHQVIGSPGVTREEFRIGDHGITVEVPPEILQSVDRRLHFGLYLRKEQRMRVLPSIVLRGISRCLPRVVIRHEK